MLDTNHQKTLNLEAIVHAQIGLPHQNPPKPCLQQQHGYSHCHRFAWNRAKFHMETSGEVQWDTVMTLSLSRLAQRPASLLPVHTNLMSFLHKSRILLKLVMYESCQDYKRKADKRHNVSAQLLLVWGTVASSSLIAICSSRRYVPLWNMLDLLPIFVSLYLAGSTEHAAPVDFNLHKRPWQRRKALHLIASHN